MPADAADNAKRPPGSGDNSYRSDRWDLKLLLLITAGPAAARRPLWADAGWWRSTKTVLTRRPATGGEAGH